ncbi:Spindle pole body component SPC97 [Candida viswanathii]|uniref:Spindle pole body component n=1 Tax=Candida viswanathii TaxID=5486 RepID=A0A367XZV9_9ASCO|nr:Spindle pole body component SPC97 [Candida viswanathii]
MDAFSSPHNVAREYETAPRQLPFGAQFSQFPAPQEPDYVSLTPGRNRDDDIMAPCIDDTITYRLQKVSGPLLSQITNLNIQQALIIRELLFTLLGYEGHYIQYSRHYDPSSPSSRIQGPDYKIAKHLDISLKNIAKRLMRFGKQYSGLRSFVQIYDDAKFGRIVQRFCFEVSEFLNQYQKVIMSIENEFKFNKGFNLNMLDQTLHQEVANRLSHFYEISLEIDRVTEERRSVAQVDVLDKFEPSFIGNNTLNGIDSEPNLYHVKSDCCKGGLLLQIIQERMIYYKGDPVSLGFLTRLFDTVSIDYVSMLNQWLLEGVIDDPFDEFLVREKKVPPAFLEAFQSKSEYYWNELFIIKTDGLLHQFRNSSIQAKILNTGKYLNIFKNCTGFANFEKLQEKLINITSLTAPDLELRIDEFYQRANKMLMKLLFEGYGFPSVVDIFQKLFLLSDSLRIDKFLDANFQDLKKPKLKISTSRLKKQYDDIFKPRIENKVGVQPSIYDVVQENQKFTVNSESLYKIVEELLEKNLDYAIPDEKIRGFYHKVLPIRNELRVTILSGDSLDGRGKDEPTITSIDLNVSLPFPLNLVMNQQLSYQYQIMFQLLVNIKFMSKYNNINWQDLNYSRIWTNRHFEPKIKRLILRCRVLHSRICSFITELEMYIMHDVIEYNFEGIKQLISTTSSKLNASEVGSDINNETDHIFNGTLLGGTFNNNSIFDDKINRQRVASGAVAAGSGGITAESLLTVEQLIHKLSDYSSNLMNESLLTKKESLLQLRTMLDFVFQFNNYIAQVKKVLVLLNHELYQEFSKELPSRFNKPMDETLMDLRFQNLHDTFLGQYQQFGEHLVLFLATIKKLGERENRGLLELSDRLELCFPE